MRSTIRRLARGALLVGVVAGCSLDVGQPDDPEFDADLIAEVTRLLRDVREAPSSGDLTRFGLPPEVSALQQACFPQVTGDTTRNANRVPVDQVNRWPGGGCSRPEVQVRAFSGSVRVQDLGGRFAARVTHAVNGVIGTGLADVQVDFSGTVEVRSVDDTTGEARVQRRLVAQVASQSGNQLRVQDYTYRWVDRLGVPRSLLGPVPGRVVFAGTLVRVTPGTPRDSVRVSIATTVPLEGDARCPVGFRAGEVEMDVTGTRSGLTRFTMTC
ncbi:MAG: hypothetical protein JNL26_08735 [Gemmatimonadetes bacterium]|nr:hypothetical protein [Gemmatimonadota bacterium]